MITFLGLLNYEIDESTKEYRIEIFVISFFSYFRSKILLLFMKNYEILLIINPQFSDEEIHPFLEGVFNVIKRNNGEVKEHKILGRNKLAYPVKHAKFGVYVLAQVEIESRNVEKLIAEFSMMPEILRFDVSNEISKSDFTLKPFEAKDQNESETSMMAAREERVDSAVENMDNKETVVKAAEKSEEPEMTEDEAEKKAKDHKSSIDELDKKLDEILKEEII